MLPLIGSTGLSVAAGWLDEPVCVAADWLDGLIPWPLIGWTESFRGRWLAERTCPCGR